MDMDLDTGLRALYPRYCSCTYMVRRRGLKNGSSEVVLMGTGSKPEILDR